MDQGRKRGMPSRGERSAISIRVPIDQRAVFEERAAALGIPLSSWSAIVLAEAAGLPIPDYVEKEIRKAAARRAIEEGQEELPLARPG